MKTHVRKIIAKEVLIFLICFSIATISYFGVGVYNYIQKTRLSSNKQLISEYNDSVRILSANFLNKVNLQRRLFESLSKNFDLGSWDTAATPLKLWEKFNALIKSDSLREMLERNTKNGFKKSVYDELNAATYDELTSSFEKNTINMKDRLAEKRSESFRLLIDNLSSTDYSIYHSFYDDKERIHFVFQVFLYSVLLLYGLRYFIILFWWSINTLKEKP